MELQCTEMVGVVAAVYRDGWRLSKQRWLELELQCTELVGVDAKVLRDGWTWSYSVQ
jgi:hypothetical protein